MKMDDVRVRTELSKQEIMISEVRVGPRDVYVVHSADSKKFTFVDPFGVFEEAEFDDHDSAVEHAVKTIRARFPVDL